MLNLRKCFQSENGIFFMKKQGLIDFHLYFLVNRRDVVKWNDSSLYVQEILAEVL